MTTDKQGASLRQFIEAHLKDRVSILRQRPGSSIIGIVPAEAEKLDIGKNVFQAPEHSSSTPQYLGFKTNVWHAFESQIPEGQKRWLILGDKAEIVDQAEPPSSDKTAYEIDNSEFDIRNKSGKELALAIKEWAEDKDVPLNQITRNRSLKKNIYFDQNSNLLDELFRRLDATDLSRISMPLDIVEKLRGTKRS
jgi:hypothetical protein